jgi:uncharacterized RDD family membrane protein YckC
MSSLSPARMVALDTTAAIETPEHVQFSVRIAGPTKRGLAYLLDLLIRGAFLFALLLLMVAFDVVSDVDQASGGVLLVVMFAVEWGYYVLFETLWNGQSPGKKAVSIRTVKEGGYPITFIDVVLRNLVRAADALPVGYVVGLAVMSLDGRYRRLGDMVAGTMVVSEERSRLGAALSIQPPPTPEELASIPSHAHLSAPELDAVELFLRRVGTLAPAREEELAAIVAPSFAQRMGVTYQSPSRFLAVLYHHVTHRGKQ